MHVGTPLDIQLIRFLEATMLYNLYASWLEKLSDTAAKGCVTMTATCFTLTNHDL